MHEDKTVNGKAYRVIVDPPSLYNPAGSCLGVYLMHPDLERLYFKQAATETEAELLAEGWQYAQSHAIRR